MTIQTFKENRVHVAPERLEGAIQQLTQTLYLRRECQSYARNARAKVAQALRIIGVQDPNMRQAFRRLGFRNSEFEELPDGSELHLPRVRFLEASLGALCRLYTDPFREIVSFEIDTVDLDSWVKILSLPTLPVYLGTRKDGPILFQAGTIMRDEFPIARFIAYCLPRNNQGCLITFYPMGDDGRAKFEEYIRLAAFPIFDNSGYLIGNGACLFRMSQDQILGIASKIPCGIPPQGASFAGMYSVLRLFDDLQGDKRFIQDYWIQEVQLLAALGGPLDQWLVTMPPESDAPVVIVSAPADPPVST